MNLKHQGKELLRLCLEPCTYLCDSKHQRAFLWSLRIFHSFGKPSPIFRNILHLGKKKKLNQGKFSWNWVKMLSGVFAFLMFALLKYLMLHLSLRWTQWNRGLRLVEHGTVLANPSQVSDHCCWIQAVKSPWPPAHCFSWTCSDSSALIWFISDWLRRAAGGRQGRRHRLFSSVVRYIQMFIFTTSYLAVLESFLAKTWGAE